MSESLIGKPLVCVATGGCDVHLPPVYIMTCAPHSYLGLVVHVDNVYRHAYTNLANNIVGGRCP